MATENGPRPLGQPSKQPSNSSASMMRVKLDDTKAGMKGLDKEKINKIILDASKGSKFYQNEQRREAELAAKIRVTLDNLRRLPKSEIVKATKRADAIFEATEASRDFARTIVHVDMDCFYAAVHMRDDPSLKKIPMAVGGIGMLSTSNYIARRFGVRAAMPGFIAKKLCPELVIIPSDFPKYNAVAAVVRGVIAEYDAEFESAGCDEAYLDLTRHLVERGSNPEPKELVVSPENESMVGCCRCNYVEKDTAVLKDIFAQNESKPIPIVSEDIQRDSAVELNSKRFERRASLPIIDRQNHNLFCPSCDLILPGIFRFSNFASDAVEEMRLKIFLQTRLTASAGVAPNAPLAKICSDQNKPNGQFILDFDRSAVLDFVNTLPVRKWPFIGKVQEKMLHGLEVFDLGDVRAKRAELLLTVTSEGSFEYYVGAALGVGRNRICGSDGERKSISTETTFSTMTDHEEMLKHLKDLCGELSGDAESKGYFGKTITLKLKNDDFKVISRATTPGFRTREAEKMFRVTSALLKAELKKNPNLRLRLMGVRLSQLEESNKEGVESQSGIHKFFGNSDKEKKGREAEKGTLKRPEPSQPTSAKSALICPICESFETKSLESLNSHVDSCLLSENQRDEFRKKECRENNNGKKKIESGRSIEEAEKPREIDSDEDLFDDDDEGSLASGDYTSDKKASEDANVGFFATKLTSLASSHVSPPPPLRPPTYHEAYSGQVPTVSSREFYLCPICNLSISGDLSHFNHHIDVCISRPSPAPRALPSCSTSSSTTSTLSPITNSAGSKRKRNQAESCGKGKIRRIDSFFAKST